MIWIFLAVLMGIACGYVLGRYREDPHPRVPTPLEQSPTFETFQRLEVEAGRWHLCPSVNEVRPTTQADCTHCSPGIP